MGHEQRIDYALREYKTNADKRSRLEKHPEGWLQVFDIQPKDEIAPPVLLVQGWGVDFPRYRKMQEITTSGRRVIALHPQPYGIRPKNFSRNIESENERKAQMYLNVLEMRGIDKLDSIAISGGTLPLLRAAKKQPERFGNIALITPACVNGSIGGLELSKRFIAKDSRKTDLHLRDRKVDMSILHAGVEFMLHIAANPRRAAHEIASLGGTDSLNMCAQVSQKGVDITAVVARDDTLFPLQEFYKNLDNFRGDFDGKPSPFSTIVEVEGKHDESSILGPSRVSIALQLLNKKK